MDQHGWIELVNDTTEYAEEELGRDYYPQEDAVINGLLEFLRVKYGLEEVEFLEPDR